MPSLLEGAFAADPLHYIAHGPPLIFPGQGDVGDGYTLQAGKLVAPLTIEVRMQVVVLAGVAGAAQLVAHHALVAFHHVHQPVLPEERPP